MAVTPPLSPAKPRKSIPPEILGATKPRPNNTIHIVVAKKITKEDLEHKESQENLVRFTEKLAEEAKSGTLKGLGGFAEYADGYYKIGLEGSYLFDPGSAILPVERLKRRIMDQIVSEE